MEPQDFVIVGLQSNRYGEIRVDGRRPSELLLGELFTTALDDEFLVHLGAVPKHGFLEFNGNFPVFQQAARGVDLDHRLVLEILKLGLGRFPLRMKVLVGHVVPCVVEIAAERATGGPPPVATLGSQNDGDGAARRSVGQHLRRGVDRGGFTRIPGLLLGFGPRRVGRGLDQVVDAKPFLPASKQRQRIGARHAVHLGRPSAFLVSNHRIRLTDAFLKERHHSVPVLIRLRQHQGDVRENAFLVAVVVSHTGGFEPAFSDAIL